LLQLIESQHIDKEKWNLLAQQTKVSFQNFSLFLDTLAEHWCAIILDDYRGGIAIPYTVRLGVKGIFAPPMTAPFSWIGEKPDNFAEINLILRKKFQRSYYTHYDSLFYNNQTKIYQRINYTSDYKISYSTRKNVHKFERTGLKIQKVNVEQILEFVVSELHTKMNVLTPHFVARLRIFLSNYEHNYCYGIFDTDTNRLHAGMILLESHNEITSIHCATDAFGRKNRMMYALTHKAILLAMEKRKDFNFGGSSIDSIRYFNHRFGAEDNFYYCWEWDNSPFWFHLLLKLRNWKIFLRKKINY